MLRRIEGTVISFSKNTVLVNVHGFGISLFTTLHGISAYTTGEGGVFYTHLVARDGGVELFGFPTKEELVFFELLLTVSGVGPRSALSVLNLSPILPLARAIRAKDVGYLTKVAGVGKKLAEKIVVELSEKVPETDLTHHSDDGELLDTLVALGYAERDARSLIKKIPNTLTGKNERLRYALKDKSL
jgi:Holliday junction DNA helicase RuvA